ncbi:MAG: protein kinase domain-containing protein [Bacilli bacterium]
MELVVVENNACVKKTIPNEDIYYAIMESKIDGIPEIIRIEQGNVYYKYVNGETLRNRIENANGVSKDFVRFLIFSVATILSNLRELNIVHNEITPDNIIISPKGMIFLIDFDSASFENESPKEYNVSLYSSPEVCANSKTSFHSDIYSLGKIVEEIDTDNNYKNIVKKCVNKDVFGRYNSYTALTHEINTTYLKLSENDETINWNYYISKKVLFIIAIFVINGAVIGHYLSNFSKSANTLIYMVFSIYASLLFLDFCDYIRLFMFSFKLYKKILPIKVFISFIMFFITIIVSLLLM